MYESYCFSVLLLLGEHVFLLVIAFLLFSVSFLLVIAFWIVRQAVAKRETAALLQCMELHTYGAAHLSKPLHAACYKIRSPSSATGLI